VQPAVRHSLRPRLVAIAPTASEAVQSAGGWLFDQVLAGWDATVITPELTDRRPLRILGVRDHSLESALSYESDGTCLSAIALPAAMFASDERVRRMVLAAVETGLPELRLWGKADVADAGLRSGGSPVAHRLSGAARAFKAQALAAVSICGEGLTDTEVFQRRAFRGLGLARAL
jgi:hypothetical protein